MLFVKLDCGWDADDSRWPTELRTKLTSKAQTRNKDR